MRAVERPAITAEMNRHITDVSLLKIKTVPLMKRICTCDVHFQPCVQDNALHGGNRSQDVPPALQNPRYDTQILNYRDFALLAGPTRRRYIRKGSICLQVLQRARE